MVMALTRRAFVQTIGAGAAGVAASSYIGARGREDSIWSLFEPRPASAAPVPIVISSNENPLGPGRTVLDAVRAAFGVDGRAPGRYSLSADDLVAVITK